MHTLQVPAASAGRRWEVAREDAGKWPTKTGPIVVAILSLNARGKHDWTNIEHIIASKYMVNLR